MKHEITRDEFINEWVCTNCGGSYGPVNAPAL
jgi:hypothetical protein